MMFQKLFPPLLNGTIRSKIITLTLILFPICLSDAILSFWVPNFIQGSLKSSAAMGLIISFSSVVGFMVDLVLPQAVKGIAIKRFLAIGIAANLVFSFLLLGATYFPHVVVFLAAMAIWGVYYEFLGFAQQEFVAHSTPLKLRSTTWGILIVFKSFAYLLGPLLGSLFLLRGQQAPILAAVVFALIGFGGLMSSNKRHDRPMEIDTTKINLLGEIKHWLALFKYVWPVVTLSLYLGVIDATFWTTGAVFTQQLAKQSFWGGFFLPFYTLPSLFIGFFVAKLGIYRGKKRLAIKLLFFSNLFLVGLGLSNRLLFQLLAVFGASTLLFITVPLTDAVYSDIVARMKRQRHHLIGLSNSSVSVAYIITPALVGVTAGLIGERFTFLVVGLIGILVAAVLLAVTPKKLRLPQQEIRAWE